MFSCVLSFSIQRGKISPAISPESDGHDDVFFSQPREAYQY